MARIASLLVTARREAGLTQRDLAQAAGLPQPSVSRIERGLISPRASTVERWLEACGRTLTISPIAAAAAPPQPRSQPQPSPELSPPADDASSDWAPWLR